MPVFLPRSIPLFRRQDQSGGGRFKNCARERIDVNGAITPALGVGVYTYTIITGVRGETKRFVVNYRVQFYSDLFSDSVRRLIRLFNNNRASF